MHDMKALADAVFKSVEGYLAKALKPMAERLNAFEKALAELPAPEQGEKGEPGLNGKDGSNGIDGKDGTPGERGVAGERGENGDPGIDGKDGVPGCDGEVGPQGPAGKDCAPEEVAALVLPQLKAMVDAIPKPQNGKDGAPGKSVTAEELMPMFELTMAKALLDFERRATDILQRAIEKMPVPKDGRNALELEDLQVTHDGEGNVVLRFARGELVKEFGIRLPRFKDCGVFREGEYRLGDGVSSGGSFFIAQKDAPAGKPGDSSDWRLAVKRGRDGKDGVNIEPPAPLEPVRLK